jgi:TP901 family phage tail tape measure protein
MAESLKIGINIDLSQMKAAIEAAQKALKVFGAAAKAIGDGLGKSVFGPAVQAAQAFGRTMQNALGGITKTAGIVSLALGGLGTGLSLAGATQTIANFDQAVASLGAISGASEEDMARLAAEARRLGAETRYTAAESAQAMIYAAQQGYDAMKIMASTPGFLSLAQAGGLGLAEAALIATSTLSGFGLAADQAARVADVMAAAANASGTNVEQLGEAFKFVSAPAAAAGIAIEETSAILGVMANSAIRGEMAGNSLKYMILRLGSGIKPVTDGLASIGLTMQDVNLDTNTFVGVLEKLKVATAGLSGSQRNNVFRQLFGTQRATGAGIAVRDVEQIKVLQERLDNAGGSAEATAAKINNTLPAAFKSLQSSAEELALKFGDGGFKGALAGAVNVLTGLVRGIGETGLAGAFGSAVAGMIEKAGQLGESIRAALGGVDWETSGFLDGMLQVLQPVIELIKTGMKLAMGEAVNFLGEAMKSVARVFGEQIAGVVDVVANAFLGVADAMTTKMIRLMVGLSGLPDVLGGGAARKAALDIGRDRAGLRDIGGGDIRGTVAEKLAEFGQSKAPLIDLTEIQRLYGELAASIMANVVSAVGDEPTPKKAEAVAKQQTEKNEGAMKAFLAEQGLSSSGATRGIGGVVGGLAGAVNLLFGRNSGEVVQQKQLQVLERIAKQLEKPPAPVVVTLPEPVWEA